MFNDEVYKKAELVLEKMTEMNKEKQTFKKGYFTLSVDVLSELKAVLNELLGIKSKTYSQSTDQLAEEDKFFISKGYSLNRTLGLAIHLFEDNISLPQACFELLEVLNVA